MQDNDMIKKKINREACERQLVGTPASYTDVIFTNVAAQFGAVCESQEEEYKTELNKLIIDPSVEIEHVEDVTALHTTWSHLSELESSLGKMVGCIAAEVNSTIVSTLGENFQAELSQQEIGSVGIEIIEDFTILHGSWSDLQKAENFIRKKQDSRPSRGTTIICNDDCGQLKAGHKDLKSGKSTSVLTADEENKLADYLTLMSERNSKRAMVHLEQMAYCILPKGKKIKDHRKPRSWASHKQASRYWCCGFLCRHPSVSLLRANSIRRDFPSCVTPDIIETFYNTLAETTARLNLSNAPERVYNCDTTRIPFPLDVFPKSSAQICNITIMACGNATGHLLPPVVIFQGKKTRNDIRLSAPDDWYIRFTEDGCLRAEIFEEWFEFVFVPSLGPERPVLLLLDTYRSRETLHVVEIAKNEQIEILMFPLNTTKLLQPINIFLFDAAREQFRKEAEQLAEKAARPGRAGQQLDKTSICPILNKVLQNLPPSTLTDGFRETGISPYKRLTLADLHRHMIDNIAHVSSVANVETKQQMSKDTSQHSWPSGAMTSSLRPTGGQTKKKKRLNYNRSHLKIAFDALKLGKFNSLVEAAHAYGVPIGTLKDRRLGRVQVDCKVGAETILTGKEENQLVDYLISMSERGLKRSTEQVKQMAYCIAAKATTKSEQWAVHRKAGKQWYQGFRDRHKDLPIQTVRTLRFENSRQANSSIIKTFYNTLSETTARLNISNAPGRIYNCDSTQIPLDVLDRFSEKYCKSSDSSSDTIRTTSLMICGNATGHLLPPVVIFQGHNTCNDITVSAPDDWCIRFTEDGCVRADIFEEWFEFVFVPSLGPERPVLLLLDIYRSRETLRVVEIAKNEQIEILMFPLNTTQLLQPINIFLFDAAREQFRKEAEQLAEKAGRPGRAGQQLDKTSICPILNKVLQNLPPSTLTDGFRETGISPYKRLTLADLQRHMIDNIAHVSSVANVETKQQMSKDTSQQSVSSGDMTSSLKATGRQTKTKKRLNYNRSHLKIAFEALKLGKFNSIVEAAHAYGVPIATLKDRTLGKVKVDCKVGAETILTGKEENQLVDYLISMSERGLKRSTEQVKQMAYCIPAKATTRSEQWAVHRKAGKQWYQGFRDRHKDLPIQTVRTLRFENSKQANSSIIKTFYNTLSETTARLNISNAPARIYNCDSTQIPLDVLDRFSEKYCKSSDSSSDMIRTTSLMICGNAAGHLLPPVVIFQGNNICNDITVSAPDEWYVRFTEDGCLRADIFEEWFEFVFVPSLGPDRPVLLLLDIYRSRETLRVVEIAKKEQIEILMFPLYTTKLLQPLNVSLFGSIKEQFEKELNASTPGDGDQLLKMTSFCTPLFNALGKLPPSILVDGFRKTGISPYKRLTLGDLRRSRTDEVFPLGPVTDRKTQQHMPNIPQQSNELSIPQSTDIQTQQTDHLKRSNTAPEKRAKRSKPEK